MTFFIYKPWFTRKGKLVVNELCTCGAYKTEHQRRFDHESSNGHGSCPTTLCEQFTWKEFVYSLKSPKFRRVVDKRFSRITKTLYSVLRYKPRGESPTFLAWCDTHETCMVYPSLKDAIANAPTLSWCAGCSTHEDTKDHDQ